MTPSSPPSHAARPRARGLALLALVLSLGALAPSCGRGGASESSGRGLVFRGASSDETRPYFHDFGAIAEGEVVTHTFELANTDPEPVTIQRLTPACTCTVGRVYCIDSAGERSDGAATGEPVLTVPPDAVLYVEFEVDSRRVERKNVDKLAIVSLTCDSPNTPFVRFELHTVVQVPLQANPFPLDLRDVPQGAGGRATSDVVTALPASRIEVLGIASAPEGFAVSIDPSETFGERVWTVGVELPPGLPLGPVQGEVHLAVSGTDGTGEGRPFVLPVRARIVEDVVIQPQGLSFGRFAPDSGARAEGAVNALVPGERVAVVEARLSGERAEELSVDYRPVEPDGRGRSASWVVAVTAPPGLEGETFTAWLELELDHPQVTTIRTPVVCRPR